MKVLQRKLGKSDIEVVAIGMGCWALGGPLWMEKNPAGWGKVDDDQSIRSIHRGLDLGANFFDTADVYGAGHSERVLGKALGKKRGSVVVATKFGVTFDEQTRSITGEDASPSYIRSACESSLKRLKTHFLDLYQLHINKYDPAKLDPILETLEKLADEGKIRWYGWSTDFVEGAKVFAKAPRCVSFQQRLNVLEGSAEVLALCEEQGLTNINRGPLGMGLLTGKFRSDTKFPEDDVRHGWNLRSDDKAKQLRQLEDIREVLCSDGRSSAQGALAWLLAHSSKTLPIPGFKTEAQVEENLGTLKFGPLNKNQIDEISAILSSHDASG